MKTCTLCKENKEYSEFYKQSKAKNGLSPVCKVCVRDKSAAYRKVNLEKTRASVAKWQKTNPKKAITSSTAYYRANIEKIKAYNSAKYQANAEKVIAQTTAYRIANPEKVREQQLKRKFGITLEQYGIMLIQQEDRCAICRKHRSEFKKNFAVDHNRETGKVRALLCGPCNTSLGGFKESIANLQNAIEYIIIHNVSG